MRPTDSRARFAVLCVLSLAAALPAPLAAALGRWSPLGPEGGTVFAIAFAPSDPRVVYAALSSGGVFHGADGGATWAPLNDGLPAIAFSGPLRLDAGTRTLYAGTYGSGFWAFTLP